MLERRLPGGISVRSGLTWTDRLAKLGHVEEEPRMEQVFEKLEEIDDLLAGIFRSTKSPSEWALRACISVRRAELHAWKRKFIQDWP